MTPTSRKACQPPSDADWGVDTVSLCFPVLTDQCDHSASFWTADYGQSFRDSGRQVVRMVGHFTKGHATVRVSLDHGRESCSLTFNAARLLGPKSPDLLPPGALLPLLSGIIDDLQDVIRPRFDSVDPQSGLLIRNPDWARECRFSRLDLARNFHVDDPSSVKQAVEAAIPRNHKRTVIHRSADGGWTVENKTKSNGSDRMYDKDAELQSQKLWESLGGSGQRLRFETQLQKDRLDTLGLRTLNSVNDECVWQAITERWVACRWDVSVAGRDSLLTATSGLARAEQERLIGYLYRTARERSAVRDTPGSRRLYMKARELGLTPGAPLESLGAHTRRLDLTEGRLVDIT